MKAKKYGGLRCLRNSVTRRHLFWNHEKSYSLDEILEYQNCRCIGKRWEVSKIALSENMSRLERTVLISTEIYGIAWDMVKDPAHDSFRRK